MVLGLALALLGAGPAWSQEMARGKEVFRLCAACHGPEGQGDQMYFAPAIGGLPRWYVEGQLAKFKNGLRGYKIDDATGLRMRPMALALVTAEDLKSVAAYVATLKPRLPARTLKGDAARGQATFATCAACHGPQAAGNQATSAPPLSHQADWYLASQIVKFRTGLRGTHPSDATGAQMRPMAMLLANEQAIDDVVAYIRSLAR